jgi:hypothetical protein
MWLFSRWWGGLGVPKEGLEEFQIWSTSKPVTSTASSVPEIKDMLRAADGSQPGQRIGIPQVVFDERDYPSIISERI